MNTKSRPYRVPPSSASPAERPGDDAQHSTAQAPVAAEPSAAPTPESPPPAGGTHLSSAEQLERLENQFALLKDQLRQTQRLASLGTAAAMLAHEFNNLFTPIVSYAKYAVDQGDPELMKKALRTTLKQSAVISAMSHRILGLAMDEKESFKPVPVSSLIRETIECLGRDLTKDSIQLIVDVPETLAVRGNANQLQQVFFNLILNARHAMLEAGGTLTIRGVETSEQRVEISVCDTGCGIRPEYLEHIFSPFFTTKRQNAESEKKGLGLGLAVTKDIIAEHEGAISVQSAVDQGTTFTVVLPAARQTDLIQ